MTGPRILITYPFPLGKASGGARMTREIARHLARAGARVTLLPVQANVAGGFPRKPDLSDDEAALDRDLAPDGVTIERVMPHPLHRFLDALPVRDAVRRIVEREKVDLVLSYFIESACLPKLLAKHGVRFGFISTWQSYAKALRFTMKWVPEPLAARVRDRLLGVPHRAADVLFATSGFTRGELIDVLRVAPERIRICHLGVEPRFFDVPREAPGDAGIERLLFFGRIIPSKGVHDTLDALGRLARDGARFTFRLRGQGEHEWARKVAREHGIEDRVEVLGPANDEELRRELAWAQLAIMPSHFEAFGLAFAEAQASGLPVIAYRAGSVPEIVQHGSTGWLAELHDVDELAKHVRTALSDPATTYAYGLAGRERVRARFTWERTAATLLGGVHADGPQAASEGAPSGPTHVAAEGARAR